MKERIRIRSSANAIAFGELCLALNDDRLSRRELAEHVGISDGAVRTWINILRARKLIYVCERRKNHQKGQYEEVFTWGYQEKDIEKVKIKTAAEYSRIYRARKLEKETLYGIQTSQESSSNLP